MRDTLRCDAHLREAGFACETCNVYLCGECVEHTWAGHGFQDLCRKCRSPAQRLDTRPAAEPGLSGFLRRAPVIFRYPVRPTVLLTLLGLSVFAWITGFLGPFGGFLLAGATASLYFHMITCTSRGDEVLDPPDFSDFFDHLIRPIGWMIVAHLPLIVAGVWCVLVAFEVWTFLALADQVRSLRLQDLMGFIGPAILAIIGIALLPLLTAIAALTRSVVAILDPRIWWRALSIMGSTYVIYAAGFYLVYLVEISAWSWMLIRIEASLPIPVLTSILVFLLGYVPMALRARLIGALCEPFLDEL